MHINARVCVCLCPLSFFCSSSLGFILKMHQVKDLCYYWIGFDYVFVHPISSVFFFLIPSFSSCSFVGFWFRMLSCVQVQASKHTECFICYCCCCPCCYCCDMNREVYLIVSSIVFKMLYTTYYLLLSISNSCIDKMMIVPKTKSGQHLSVNVERARECGQNAIE